MKVFITIVMTLLLAASSARGQDDFGNEFGGDAVLYDNDALLRATLSEEPASADGEIIGFDFGVKAGGVTAGTAGADVKQGPAALPVAGATPPAVTAIPLPAAAWGGLGLMLGLTGMRFYRRWTRPEAISF